MCALIVMFNPPKPEEPMKTQSPHTNQTEMCACKNAILQQKLSSSPHSVYFVFLNK